MSSIGLYFILVVTQLCTNPRCQLLSLIASVVSVAVASGGPALKVGDRVRVKATVTTPKYKWGSVTHRSVGTVTGEVEREQVLVGQATYNTDQDHQVRGTD